MTESMLVAFWMPSTSSMTCVAGNVFKQKTPSEDIQHYIDIISKISHGVYVGHH